MDRGIRQRMRTGNEQEAYHGRNIMDLMQSRAPASQLRRAREHAESVANPVRDFHNHQRGHSVQRGTAVEDFPGFSQFEARANAKAERKDKPHAKWEGKPVPFIGLPADRVDHQSGVGRQIRGRPTVQTIHASQMIYHGTSGGGH